MATMAQREATLAQLRERLAALKPVLLELTDESERHAGHAGAREGGHFTLLIESTTFVGQSRLQAQRAVLQLLGDLRSIGVHALSISTRIPQVSSFN